MSPNFTIPGLECYLLNKADTRSLDFVVTRFLMKMFRTVNMDVINDSVVYILTLCCLVSCWSRERTTSCGSLIGVLV